MKRQKENIKKKKKKMEENDIRMEETGKERKSKEKKGRAE